MNTLSLAPQTGRIIEAVSKLECIKPFVLVGGTALSIQLKTRQSEDLDFMRRSKFRDYYDIYSILKNGADIHKLIPRLRHNNRNR